MRISDWSSDVCSSDLGVRQRVRALEAEGKTVKIYGVGRKGIMLARREYRSKVVEALEDASKPVPSFEKAAEIAADIARRYEAGEFDVCTVIYNKFISALTQEVTPLQLIPFAVPEGQGKGAEEAASPAGAGGAAYEVEPSEEEILADLLPRNLSVQIYRALLESFASEQGARMTAMDNATRNADALIKSRTQRNNRQREGKSAEK